MPFAAPISVIPSSAVELTAVDSWPTERVPRRVSYRLTTLESALELARRGRCVVFIPDFIARLHNRTVKSELRLARIPNPKGMAPIHQSVHILVRHERRNDPDLRLFSELLLGAIERDRS
jgi:DNA-binding transcriptional LysR family regulator